MISALTRTGCAVITSAVRSKTRSKAARRQRPHGTTNNWSVKSLHTCLDDFVKHWLTAPLREAFNELSAAAAEREILHPLPAGIARTPSRVRPLSLSSRRRPGLDPVTGGSGEDTNGSYQLTGLDKEAAEPHAA